jgi:hypothetical protein
MPRPNSALMDRALTWASARFPLFEGVFNLSSFG